MKGNKQGALPNARSFNGYFESLTTYHDVVLYHLFIIQPAYNYQDGSLKMENLLRHKLNHEFQPNLSADISLKNREASIIVCT
jgi:hypothetical protein